MKDKITKFICVVSVFATVALCLQPGAFAADKETNVLFSCYDGTIVIPEELITVSADIAERYGYTDSSDKVTVLDVIVAAHEKYYGDTFTLETAGSYLKVSSGYISLAFGKSATASGFLVNNCMPNNGIYNETYGSYTAYTCEQAEVKAGDNVKYYFYQDKSYWSDFCTWFDSNEYEANINESIDMKLQGYCAMYYGVNDYNTILSKYTLPVTDAEVFIYNSDGTTEKVGTTDENGNLSVAFDKPGTYKLYAAGTTLDDYEEECPIIAPWCTVNVRENTTEISFTEKFIALMKKVVETFVSIINEIFNAVC